MCGLVGFIAHAPAPHAVARAECVVRDMFEAMRHRGTDGEIVFVSSSSQAILAHRRLAIVSQEEHGIQPMSTHNGRYTIVFNGEIYNYQSLAQELKSAGIVQDFATDTQVLLYGFATWGVEIFRRLRGMFACVIWDNQQQKAFFARDEFGIKPLYWAPAVIDGAAGILFSSEIKSLLASGLIARKIDYSSLSDYVQYAAIHAPKTLVENVFLLEPATVMTVGEGVSSEEFWDISHIQTGAADGYFHEYVKTVREEFIQICDLYTDINLDLGLFLSGGIDSTALLGITKKLLGRNVQTFSLGFSSPTGCVVDESVQAAKTAQAFGVEHRELSVDGYMARLAFESFVTAIDQPSSDGFNTFLISRFAGEHVRVVLSGLGGDEVFMGYRVFKDLLNLKRFESVASPRIKNLCATAIEAIPGLASLAYRTGYSLLRHGSRTGTALYQAYRELDSSVAARRVLHFDVRSKMVQHDVRVWQKLNAIFATELDTLNAFSKAELAFYVPGILCRDTDAASMSATIEVRVPFLDVRFVERVVGLPSGYKCWRGQKTNKPLFVEAFNDVLPADVASSHKKGFEMPVGFWLKSHFKDQLQRLKDCEWLDHNEITALCDALHENPREYRKVWSLLVLAEWIEQHEMTF